MMAYDVIGTLLLKLHILLVLFHHVSLSSSLLHALHYLSTSVVLFLTFTHTQDMEERLTFSLS